MISEKALKEYKKIYKEKFGKDISDKDALEEAINLLTLMDVIYRPITVEQYKALQKRRLETGDITENEFNKLIKNVNIKSNKGIAER